MSKRIGVTDHAIVRWLERHWDIPRKELVKKILRQEVTQAIGIGATSIKVDGAGEQRPVVKNGALAVATVMTVTLSTDHRCVDGALGAELIGAFKRYIENPMGMLV